MRPPGRPGLGHRGSEVPEEEGTFRYPQGNKGGQNWSLASQEDQEGSQYRYPQGPKDPWGRSGQDAQGAGCRDTADVWKDYNANKGSSAGGQYREPQRDDTPYDFRGWRKGWHQG